MWARDEHWFSCPGWDGIPHELQDDADFWLYVANRGFQLEFIGFKEECLRKKVVIPPEALKLSSENHAVIDAIEDEWQPCTARG